MTKPSVIEVFSELTLHCGSIPVVEVGGMLVRQADGHTWRHAHDREDMAKKSFGVPADFFAFEREQLDNIPKTELILWGKGDSMRVSNIVPTASGRLSYSEYNLVLEDFATQVLEPVAHANELRVEHTSGFQGLVDWLSPQGVRKLEVFSACANRSTGSGHPNDRDRWLDFIIAAHEDRSNLSGRLSRWLIEAEKWPEEIARELESEYELGRELLGKYVVKD